MVYSTRRFVLCLALCYYVLVFVSPYTIAITSLGEGRANHSVFHTFVWFAFVWFCEFPLPLCVWEGLRFVIVALPGPFLLPFVFWCFFFGGGVLTISLMFCGLKCSFGTAGLLTCLIILSFILFIRIRTSCYFVRPSDTINWRTRIH